MSHFCLKPSCPNRTSIGKPEDEDVINGICWQCERVIYISDSRTTKVKKQARMAGVLLTSLAVFIFMVIVLFDVNPVNALSEVTNDTPEGAITKYFNLINEGDLMGAYGLTQSKKWKTFDDFKRDAESWHHIKELGIAPQDYYSFYKADTILRVDYELLVGNKAKDYTQLQYDYHLKQFGERWKIVRYITARDPEVDALYKHEAPKNSVQCVQLFLELLGERKMKKAYLLVEPKGFGEMSEFEKEETWGGFKYIDEINVELKQTTDNRIQIVHATFEAGHTSFEGTKSYELDFYVSYADKHWRVVDVKE